MQGPGHSAAWRDSGGCWTIHFLFPDTVNYRQLRSKHKGLAGAFEPHKIKSLVSKPSHTLKDSNAGPWHRRAGRKEGRGAKNL